MDPDGCQVEARGVRFSLPPLARVTHEKHQMARRVKRFLCEDVAHARDLITAMAAEAVVGVVRRARARRRVARKARLRPSLEDGGVVRMRQSLRPVGQVAPRRLQRARVHVPLARAVIGPAVAVKLGEVGYHPRTRAHVRRVVVMARRIRESLFAERTVAAALDATGILDG